MQICVDDLQGPEIASLLQSHLDYSRKWSPLCSVHALGLDALRAPQVTIWTAWDGSNLMGCGALREIEPFHGEIKSMHTVAECRRRGVASGLLTTILDAARNRSYRRLSLETGSTEGFAAARALYARFGFAESAPFGNYVADANSVFMTLDLSKGHIRVTGSES